jgi:uncharacterized protein (TIGR00730 family)
MPSERLRVCVFCSSSDEVDPRYRLVAAQTGRGLAERGWHLVYGGGNLGLMGEVARAALAAGAEVTGVIPERLALREIALEEVTELVRTETLRERKALMDARSDAFLVLPGGIGTLEELVEILTLKQLGFHERAIVVLDPDGYWAPLQQQLDRMVDQRLADPSLLELWTVVDEVDAALDAIAHYRAPAPPRTPADLELEAIEGPDAQRILRTTP